MSRYIQGTGLGLSATTGDGDFSENRVVGGRANPRHMDCVTAGDSGRVREQAGRTGAATPITGSCVSRGRCHGCG
ncbi:hypothetical protein C8Q80DRAFT_149321 [Daedaleopsis nitida]|nr:hypothetical protein C8Q80DRAFT_149321 [Daedaleopsis nitida]